MNYLGIDQYGNKTMLPDLKHKTLKEVYYCGNIKPMYQDTLDQNSGNWKSYKTGYVLGQGRGNYPLWVRFFKTERVIFN